MCIRVVQVDVASELVFWSRADVAIVVRRGTRPSYALREIHAILEDMGAAQDGPTPQCFCGDTVPLPADLQTAHRGRPTDTTRQVLRGA
jgi:hypothetical protein